MYCIYYLHFSVNTDPIGVELAGALKNVYAIASGVSGGLGFEANTRAGEICFSSLCSHPLLTATFPAQVSSLAVSPR